LKRAARTWDEKCENERPDPYHIVDDGPIQGGSQILDQYIADVAVAHGWLAMEQMLIGLGLAESTPGPLIMVTQYVGFLGAWNLPGGLDPLTAGILGALITTCATFLPCFFFIFAGAPFIEAMAGNQWLQAALTGVTATGTQHEKEF
jgi:chromate transporter